MSNFDLKLKLSTLEKKEADELLKTDDIDLLLERAYALKVKGLKPKAINAKTVYEMPTLKDVREKTESLYESGFAKDWILTEGTFVCGRCKKTKIYYQTKQTRSGDEAETVFYTCNNCGNKWRS